MILFDSTQFRKVELISLEQTQIWSAVEYIQDGEAGIIAGRYRLNCDDGLIKVVGFDGVTLEPWMVCHHLFFNSELQKVCSPTATIFHAKR